MEYRNLGKAGLKVPVLSLGTATFGGTNEFFRRWGTTDLKEASRLIDICVGNGVNFFDTADVYSQGASEEILGYAQSHPSEAQRAAVQDWVDVSVAQVGRGIGEYARRPL